VFRLEGCGEYLIMLGMDCGIFLVAFVGGVGAYSLRYGDDLILSDEF
jgi:hypothetical protein